MELGMIGLGRMGGNMALRLQRGGHQVIGTSRTRATVEKAQQRGLTGVFSVPDLIGELKQSPRVVWVMVPAGEATDQMLQQLVDLLAAGDIVVDGGNSNYHDTVRRAAWLKEQGLRMADAGTSGGVWGLEHGYSLMVGGEPDTVAHLRPLLETLAPAPDRGWGHVGPCGAGHFVKMVHNGIEYGMMQALAEGFALMEHKPEFHLDLHQVAEVWRFGSVVQSWLLDLVARALEETPDLSQVAPYVADSGEGRWTVQEAIDQNLAAPVITLSLLQRLRSRDEESFADRLLALMRQQFGGHAIKREGE